MRHFWRFPVSCARSYILYPSTASLSPPLPSIERTDDGVWPKEFINRYYDNTTMFFGPCSESIVGRSFVRKGDPRVYFHGGLSTAVFFRESIPKIIDKQKKKLSSEHQSSWSLFSFLFIICSRGPCAAYNHQGTPVRISTCLLVNYLSWKPFFFRYRTYGSHIIAIALTLIGLTYHLPHLT